MMPASLRLSWATRGSDTRGLVVLAATIAGVVLGRALVSAKDAGPQLVYWCSGTLTAALIALDFPGGGHVRWGEFELSLPLAPRERARARLVLSLASWLLPVLAAFALSQLGVFGEAARLPLAEALVVLANVSSCVLLAVALRHTIGLDLAGLQSALLRLLMIAVVVAHFVWPSPWLAATALLTAVPLLASAHRAATRVPELCVSYEAGNVSALHSATLGSVALQYVTGRIYGRVLLLAVLLWAFAINSGWLPAAPNVFLVAFWCVYHVARGARLLRLGHLPYPRARLFRFVAWPSLAALALGLGLSLVLPRVDELGSIQEDDGAFTLQVSPSAWRLTTGVPPSVIAPNGESHAPRAHSFGLGASLVAYDPYEIPTQASREFALHQLGRLLLDQRGLALPPQQIEQRYVSDLSGRRRLTSERYPELTDPMALRARLASGALLILLALTAMHMVIQPGEALGARAYRRQVLPWFLIGLFLILPVQHLLTTIGRRSADPVSILMAEILRHLAANPLLVFPAAVAVAVLLYRQLVRRFEQMEAPPRAKAMDNCFIEV